MSLIDLEVQALEKVKNKYMLTILMSKRINQLKKGRRPLIAVDHAATFYEIALREIVEEKITLEQVSLKPVEAETGIAGAREFQMPPYEDLADQGPIEDGE